MTAQTKPTVFAQTVYLTTDAFMRIRAADAEWIGTDDYMGIAYFWAYEYRHALRDATAYKRVQTHRAFLDAGLEPSGDTPEHEAIVCRLFPHWKGEAQDHERYGHRAAWRD